MKPVKYKLPKEVGGYRFIKKFHYDDPNSSFKFGVYENIKTHKKVFGKMWADNVKDFYYYSLKNEIAMYKLLNIVMKRVNKKTYMSKRVTVPRLIDVVETEGKVILFIEYVEGKIANNLSLDKKIKVYWEVVSFLEYLGKNFTKKEKSMVSKRTNADFLLLYPFLLAKAIISHPTYAIILLKGGFRYFLYCTSILKRKKEIFIHRDLHLKNVIISKRKAYLIDLEFCVISDLLYELITTLRVRWHEKKFSQNILKNIIKEFGKNKGFEKLFKALVINSATHGLTAKFEKKKISYWIEFLKFGMDFKINKINVYEK